MLPFLCIDNFLCLFFVCSQWGKAVRKGMGDSRRGSSQIANIADELMARRGSGRGSELGLRPYDYVCPVLSFCC